MSFKKWYDNLNAFQIARLKLTMWYFLCFLSLIIFFTVITFEARRAAYFRVYQVINTNSPGSSQLVEFDNKFQEFNQRYQQRLVQFDILLIIIGTFLSWFLSGKTLEPIKRMMSEQAAFASDVSHSLRTPLATMNLEIFAYQKTHKRIPQSFHQLATSLQEEIRHMAQITDGLLTLVRAENHSSNLHFQTISLTDLILRTYQQTKPLVEAKNQQLIIEKPDQIRIKGNPDQLKQVLLILIDNAIKYNKPKGKIYLSLKKGKSLATFIVKDTGFGIEKADLPHIFTRFYRSKNPQRLPKGTGLGLAIAGKIISFHQGNISASSKKNIGTTFKITLPLLLS